MKNGRIKRVRRGAKWLDARYPGWYQKIDMTRFEMDNPNTCVCGQVVPEGMYQNGYLAAKGRFRLEAGDPDANADAWAKRHGFFYKKDQDAWARLIMYRREMDTLDASSIPSTVPAEWHDA